MIRHNKIITNQTGQYYCFGNAEASVHTYWMAFHGYGQKANRLIKKFEIFNETGHFVVAPEGLHRFYWEGVSGNVVASWMTSENRQDDIADYVSFIDKVDGATGFSRKQNVRKIIFGFSQGCATLWRWLFNSHPDVDCLVIWAGWLPEDMLYQQHLEYLQSKKIFFIYGDEDQYLTSKRLDTLFQRFDDAMLNVDKIVFEGGHRVDKEILKYLYKKHFSQ